MAISVLVVGAVVFDGTADLRRMQDGLSLLALILSTAVAVSSGLYLLRRDDRLGWVALAAAKAGMLAVTLALLVTVIHHRRDTPSLSIWWAWEVGSSMLLLLWLAYIGYFLLRSSTEGADRSARFTAIFATLTAVDAPFVLISVRSFVAKLQAAGGLGSEYEMDAAALTLFCGLFLSFLAGMFYLYESERAQREKVSASVSVHASTG